MLPRTAWTSAPNGRAGRDLDARRVTSITCHWPAQSGVIGAISREATAGLLRAWRAQHLRQGWADIGYNYAIDQTGRIWELTGLVRGAHAGGSGIGNTTSVGVLWVLGTSEAPTPAAVEAFRTLRAWVLQRMPNAQTVWPHSHWTSTACPGDTIRALAQSGALSAPPIPGGNSMALSNQDLISILTAKFEIKQNGKKRVVSVMEMLGAVVFYGDRAERHFAEIKAQLNGVVQGLGRQGDVDVDAIAAAVREASQQGVTDAIEGITTTVRIVTDDDNQEG